MFSAIRLGATNNADLIFWERHALFVCVRERGGWLTRHQTLSQFSIKLLTPPPIIMAIYYLLMMDSFRYTSNSTLNWMKDAIIMFGIHFIKYLIMWIIIFICHSTCLLYIFLSNTICLLSIKSYHESFYFLIQNHL